MATIFVIGATGGVGSRLHPMLTAAGHRVRALHRKAEQAEALAGAGADPVAGDLMEMEVADFEEAARGADAIVFSAGAAGSGTDRTRRIDGDALDKAVTTAERLGIARFYLVSAFPEAGRTYDLPESMEIYMAVKKAADVRLANSTLDWVIVRPGTLTDSDGDGCVTLGPAIPYGDFARGNVARVLAEAIDTPALRRRILELTDGPTPVAEAVAAALR